MVRLSHCLIIALSLSICGCNTDQAQIPPLTAAPNQATIVVTRSSDMLYLAAPAALDVNGTRIADLGVGQSYSGAVASGSALLTVSAWSAPGASSLRFNAEPGKAYRFVVTPRGAQMAAGLAGGIVGQAIEGGGPFHVAVVQ